MKSSLIPFLALICPASVVWAVPTPIESSLSKSAAAIEEHRYHSAISILNNVLQNQLGKKEKACTLWLRANAHRELVDYRKASLDLSAIPQLDGFHCVDTTVTKRQVNSLRGLSYCDMKNYEFAFQMYDKLEQMYPSDMTIKLDRINCLLREQSWKKALQLIEGLDVDADKMDVVMMRIEGWIGTGRVNEAYSELNILKSTEIDIQLHVIIKRNLVLTAKTLFKHTLVNLEATQLEMSTYYAAEFNRQWYLTLLEKHESSHELFSLALSKAVTFNRIDMLKYLLEHGADPHYDDDLSLRQAEEYKRKDMLTLLQKYAERPRKEQIVDEPGFNLDALFQPKEHGILTKKNTLIALATLIATIVFYLFVLPLMTIDNLVTVRLKPNNQYTNNRNLESLVDLYIRESRSRPLLTGSCLSEEMKHNIYCQPMKSEYFIEYVLAPVFGKDATFARDFLNAILNDQHLSFLQSRKNQRQIKRIPNLAETGLYVATRYEKRKAAEFLLKARFFKLDDQVYDDLLYRYNQIRSQ